MEEIATAFAWEGGGAAASFESNYANTGAKCCELRHTMIVIGEKI